MASPQVYHDPCPPKLTPVEQNEGDMLPMDCSMNSDLVCEGVGTNVDYLECPKVPGAEDEPMDYSKECKPASRACSPTIDDYLRGKIPIDYSFAGSSQDEGEMPSASEDMSEDDELEQPSKSHLMDSANLQVLQKELLREKEKVSELTRALKECGSKCQLQKIKMQEMQIQLRMWQKKCTSNQNVKADHDEPIEVINLCDEGVELYRDALKVINQRVTRGEEAAILLVHANCVTLSKQPANQSSHPGLSVKKAVIEVCLQAAGDKFSTFVYAMCNAVFKREGAQYFSLFGSNRSQTRLRTLPLPSGYANSFLKILVDEGLLNRLQLPPAYGCMLKGVKGNPRFYKCAKRHVSKWLTTLRKKYRPTKKSEDTPNSKNQDKEVEESDTDFDSYLDSDEEGCV